MGVILPIQHRAVMEQEVLALLRCDRPAVYVDCTLGGGEHTRALLRASEAHTVIGIDRDLAGVEAARQWGQPWGARFHVVHGDFRHLQQLLIGLGYQDAVDGVLFDLGVSSYQLDTGPRGFSFRLDGPLDMRMDVTQATTACTLVNHASAEELQTIFTTLGEERWARRIARAIVATRRRAPLTSTRHLADLVAQTIPRAAWPAHIHPATRVFQALRMAVNDELPALREALPQAVAALRPGGRLAVIAFHSGEDREVKQFLRQEARGCVCPPRLPQCCCGLQPRLRLLTSKPMVPTAAEVQANPRSRSARLRAAERLNVEEA